MATRIYAIGPGEKQASVIEGVGSATSGAAIALTIDLATTVVTDGSTTRAMTRDEALIALEHIRNHIIKGNWTPA